MKARTFVTLFIVVIFAVPVHAESNFVAQFMQRYRTSEAAAPPANPPAALSQFLLNGEVPITLNDIVNSMLDQNLDIQSNRLSPRSSALQTLVFNKVLQPSLTLSATVGRNSAYSTTQLNGASTLSQLNHNYAANYAKTLASGTTLGIGITMARGSSNNAFNTFNPAYTGRITYSISQHLLQNRGRDVTLRQINQGLNNEKISETQFEIQLTSLLATAHKAYWDLVYSEGDLKVKQASLKLAKETLEENKIKVEIGSMAPIDVVQTQLDVAQRNDTVVGAQGTVTQSQDQIKKMISGSNDPSMFLINLKAMESPRQPGATDIPTLQESIAIALENRPEIRQGLLDLRNKEIDVQYAKNQKLPLLDLTASFNQNGTGGTQTIRGNVDGVSQIVQVIPGGVWDAFRQMYSYNYTGYQLGFSLIIPLSNKSAEADFSRAVNERRLSTSKIDATIQGIELEVRNALTQAQISRARLDTAKATLDLAILTAEAEQAKYDLGTSILKFVLEQQRNVATSQSAQLQAQVNYTKALVDLDRAMGMTLKRNGVQLEKALKVQQINGRTD